MIFQGWRLAGPARRPSLFHRRGGLPAARPAHRCRLRRPLALLGVAAFIGHQPGHLGRAAIGAAALRHHAIKAVIPGQERPEEAPPLPRPGRRPPARVRRLLVQEATPPRTARASWLEQERILAVHLEIPGLRDDLLLCGNTKPTQLRALGKINTRTTRTKRYCPAPDGTLAIMAVLAHGSPYAGQTG